MPIHIILLFLCSSLFYKKHPEPTFYSSKCTFCNELCTTFFIVKVALIIRLYSILKAPSPKIRGGILTSFTSCTRLGIAFPSTMRLQGSVMRLKLREECPYSELFWSVFSLIRTEYGEILLVSPYSIQMRENTDQNNFEYGHFFCSVKQFRIMSITSSIN